MKMTKQVRAVPGSALVSTLVSALICLLLGAVLAAKAHAVPVNIEFAGTVDYGSRWNRKNPNHVDLSNRPASVCFSFDPQAASEGVSQSTDESSYRSEQATTGEYLHVLAKVQGLPGYASSLQAIGLQMTLILKGIVQNGGPRWKYALNSTLTVVKNGWDAASLDVLVEGFDFNGSLFADPKGGLSYTQPLSLTPSADGEALQGTIQAASRDPQNGNKTEETVAHFFVASIKTVMRCQ